MIYFTLGLFWANMLGISLVFQSGSTNHLTNTFEPTAENKNKASIALAKDWSLQNQFKNCLINDNFPQYYIIDNLLH